MRSPYEARAKYGVDKHARGSEKRVRIRDESALRESRITLPLHPGYKD
jgi:hypothetical protein